MALEPDIVIREVDPPPYLHDATTNPTTKYYHVELYVGGMMGGPWPQGLGTVAERGSFVLRNQEYPSAVNLCYLFVIDGSRRQGYGRRIIAACIERWPDINFFGTTNGPGKLLIESMGLGHLI